MAGPTPKQEGMLPIGEARLFYQIHGDGEPLILIHAGVADSRMWRGQINPFAQKYRVITYDLRGFGRSISSTESFSNSQDIIALLEHLGVDAAHIVGISYGGLIALEFALEYPERVKRLILGAPSVTGVDPSPTIRKFWEEEEAQLAAGDLDAAVELNLRLWVDGPHRQPGEVDADMRSLVGEMQRNAFEIEGDDDGEPIFNDQSAIERISRLAMPTLVLVGELDLPEKLELSNRLVSIIPDAQLAVLPDVAHMLNMEHSEEFNRVVVEFLDKIQE